MLLISVLNKKQALPKITLWKNNSKVWVDVRKNFLLTYLIIQPDCLSHVARTIGFYGTFSVDKTYYLDRMTSYLSQIMKIYQET